VVTERNTYTQMSDSNGKTTTTSQGKYFALTETQTIMKEDGIYLKKYDPHHDKLHNALAGQFGKDMLGGIAKVCQILSKPFSKAKAPEIEPEIETPLHKFKT
jgi:hypothetical protein